MDCDLEALPVPDVKPCLSFEPECTGRKEELVDFRQGYFRQVNDVELDRIAAIDEGEICYENIPNTLEKLDKVVKLKFVRKLQQETFQSRNIFRMATNKIDSDGFENEYDSANFYSSCVNTHQERHIEPTSSEENNLFSKVDQLTPTEGTFVVRASRDYGGCDEWKPVEEEAVAYLPFAIEEGAGTKLPCLNPDLLKMKKKTLPKTVVIDPHILALSDSWYLRKKDRAAGTLNSQSLNEATERKFVISQRMCQVSKPESLDSRNQYIITNNRKVNKRKLRSPIKSMWL